MVTSISEMMNHSIFESGCRLHDFDIGLRSEYARKDLPRETVKRDLEKMFGYDHHIVDNPPGTMPHFQACRQAKGGFCRKDTSIQQLDNFTYNLYVATKAYNKAFPIFLEFTVSCGEPVTW